MEQHQNTEVEIQDEKEEILSSSPDSGLNLSYENEKSSRPSSAQSAKESEKLSSPPVKRIQCLNSQNRNQNTLYPFFYKFPDNRKLTLLKSLSQDSEYSLDTSLFDAEDFLQEMGFAGACDPTIPDRFLPSLMLRLSKFPESEIESLNDRIIQSIGCFKRKEGKRRLFRNLSMGKDYHADLSDLSSSTCSLNNSYPLLRSNTGPASFSFNDASAAHALHQMPQSGKLSLSNSNNSSFSEETVLPQSPIAILVSSASMEQEEKAPQNSFDRASLCDDVIQESDDVTPFVHSQISQTSSILQNKKTDVKMKATDEKLNAKDVVNDDVNFELTVDPQSQTITTNSEETQEFLEIKTSDENNPTQTIDFRIETSDVKDIFSFSTVSPVPSNDHNKCSVVKYPLRRLSQASNFNSRNSNYPGSLVHQNKIDDPDSPNFNSKLSGENPYNENVFESSKDDQNSNAVESSVDLSESKSSLSEKEDVESWNGIVVKELDLRTPSEINITEDSIVGENVTIKHSIVSKPKYTRDDSLTNFLSSMLDTNEDTSSPNYPETSRIFSFDFTAKANRDKRFEIPVLNPFLQKEGVKSSKINQTSKSVMPTSESGQVKEKAPNRKRRMLKRMSSSLNYCDEVMPVEDTNCTTDPSREFSTITAPNPVQSKLPLRNTRSAPQVPTCQIMYPCCCMPVMKLYPHCGTHEKTLQEGRNNVSYSSRCNHNTGYPTFEGFPNPTPNRKLKRCCKHNRYLSCPPSMSNFSFRSCHLSRRLSASAQNLDADSHSHTCHHFPSPCPRCVHSQQTIWSDDCSESEERLFSSYQGGYSSDPQNSAQWRNVPQKQYTSAFEQTSQTHFNSHQHDYTIPCTLKIDNSAVTNPFTPTSKKTFSSDDVFLPDPETYSLAPQKKHNSKLKQFDEIQVHLFQDITLSPADRFKETPSPQTFPDNSHSSDLRKEQPVITETLLSTSQQSDNERDCRRNQPLKVSNSYPLQNVDTPWQYTMTNSRMSCVERLNLESPNESASKDKLFSQNNKREALLEKKMRVFSKLLANLGNLTKPVSDAKFDSDHNGEGVPKFRDVTHVDNKSEYHISNTTVAKSFSNGDECRTASPELNKLVKLLNSMDLNKHSKLCDQDIHQKFNNSENVIAPDHGAPVYENSVFLEMKDANQGYQPLFTPVSYISSISMKISEDDKEPDVDRTEKESIRKSILEEDASSFKRTTNFRRYSLQMPFKEVSKELEELHLSIQKAKEMRISASKELHLLQELLSRDKCEDQNIILEKKNSPICTNENRIEDSTDNIEKSKLEALTDLREKSVKCDSDETAFWQDEMKKLKEENDQAWSAKLERMEKRLASQEEELRIVQNTNENLQKQLELKVLGSPTRCKPDIVQNGFGRIDSAFEDDEEYLTHKSSTPIQSSRQECERLKDQLSEAEQRADQLNLLLNQKLIELNKLQLTLSKQTKEMIELEKSYVQLQCRLRKGTSRPMVGRVCSRTSPFNSKNLCPKSSPPGSPHPNGVS